MMNNPGHIEIHLSQSTYYLISGAAKVSNVTMEEFILAAALTAAQNWASNV